MPFDGANYKTNTVADVLRRAKALIDTPEKWCSRAGMYAFPYCVMGAINAVAPRAANPEDDYGYFARDTFRNAIGTSCIPDWNDAPERTHAEVLQAFDAAIALAEAEG